MTVEDHIAVGDDLLDGDKQDEALAEFKKALGKLGTATTPVRAEIYVRIGELMQRRGKERVAISNFDKALAIRPDHRRALAAMVELNVAVGNWRAVRAAEEKYFAAAVGDEALEQLLASGDRWRDKADDLKRAKTRYDQAHKQFPKRREPLQRLLEVYEKDGKIEFVLDTRRRLVVLIDEPDERAREYFELGEYCLFELNREEEAFAAFELALDSDPTMLEALEVLATALAENQEWGELERVYIKMIGSFDSKLPLGPEAETVLVELNHRLALLYRDHLEDPDAALEVIDRELALRPDMIGPQLLAAEIASEAAQPAKALVHLRKAAKLEPRRAETYHQLFALAQRYDEPETGFLAASVVAVLDEANDRERIVFREHKVEGVPAHQRPMRPQAWEWLRHEDRDETVDGVMRAVAPAVLRVRVRQLEVEGKLPVLDEATRQDPESSTVSVVRSLSWGSQFLGVPLPALYLQEGRDGTLVVPFARHQSTIIGKDVLRGRSVAELAFLVGRHLALRLPEHELVANLHSIDELSACFLAALKITMGKAPSPPHLAKAVDGLAKVMLGHMSDDERQRLFEAVKTFQTSGGRADLNDWIASVELCATRAGLLLCGDLETANKVLGQDTGHAFTKVERRLDDLCCFAVSGSNLKLRQELGSSLTDVDQELSARSRS